MPGPGFWLIVAMFSLAFSALVLGFLSFASERRDEGDRLAERRWSE